MTISKCDACGGGALYQIYDLPRIPAFQNKLYLKQDEALKATPARVTLTACPDCDFVFNADNDSSLMDYDGDYNNCQDHSPTFRDYLEVIADLIIKGFEKKNPKIVEIGCGKGVFFGIMEERGFDIAGFDPTYEGSNPRITKQFFNHDTNVTADAIIMRHTLEHIENPYTFLKNLATFLPPTTQIFIEVPRFEWIAEKKAFWDIFHEHCNYFTERFFAGTFQGKAKIEGVFGDQYMLISAKLGDLAIKPVALNVPNYKNLFISEIPVYREMLAHHTNNLVWGAGAKGIAFANIMDPEPKAITHLVDINDKKQNRYVPLTGHLCVGPDTLNWAHMGAESCLWIMNENYADEILSTLPQSYGGTVMVMGEIAPRKKTNVTASRLCS
jgi:hypothetical protein